MCSAVASSTIARTIAAELLSCATRLMNDLSILMVVGASVRFTKANQLGLLGLGGDKHRRYSPQLEGSAGLLVTRRVLVGAEYRSKPDNLGFAREDDAYDLFAAWQVKRNVAITAAYADLGSIATVRRQRGAFLSLQASF